MISSRAREGFDCIVERSLRDGLAAGDDTAALSVRLASMDEIPESRAVMLSVASYTFRLMLFLHFDLDDRTRAHFARRLGVEAADLADQAFLDAVSEAGNMVCGTLNRELGRVFPHIGMSTPHMLDRECLLHVGRLRVGHQSHVRLTLSSDTAFHATLCVSDYADIDFDAPAEEHTAASGELEMF
jgi:hypothetical protein